MTGERQENPVLFHLDSEIYKNGLKFERDRTFRNRLIVKAIILMSVLLIIATVSCVSMSKSSSSKVKHNDTDFQTNREGNAVFPTDFQDIVAGKKEKTLTALALITKNIRIEEALHVVKLLLGPFVPTINAKNMPIYYDPGTLEPVKDRNVFAEVQTSFVPPPLANRLTAYSPPRDSTIKNERFRRRSVHDSIKGFHSKILKDSSPESKDTADNKRSGTVEDLEEGDILENKEVTNNKLNDEKKIREGEARLAKIIEISKFWKDGQDLQGVRNSQAKRMLSYMDLTVDPCDDFYQYACGNWEKNHPIPQDKAGYDIFELLRESLDVILRDLLTEPSDNNTSEAALKAKMFYESCMNEDILQKRGNEPLLQLSKELKGWPMIDKGWNASDFNWINLAAQLKLYNADILIKQWIGPDIKNSSDYVIQFDQPHLGLPSKQYYLEESNTKYLEAYKKFLITLAVLLGAEQEKATSDAEEIVHFEKELAKITLGQDERRNMSKTYAKMNLLTLYEQVPEIDWIQYLTIVQRKDIDANKTVVVIYALKYFKDLVPLIEKTDTRIVCNYIMWRFMRHRVDYLDRKFQDAKQEFFYALSGREKIPLRWIYCISHVKTEMGMALGSVFVERYFDESSKNDTVNMTQDIMHSFREMLNAIDWIDPETKTVALNKINAMSLRIGYPDYLLNKTELDKRYSGINITKTSYFENTLNIHQHMTKIEQDKLGKMVNKSEFNATPTTVNAYYSMNVNQILVPAGILQPPFYHKYFPKSLNYGGIGVVIGHEITHGFDDRGRYFDQDGNYHKWWQEETVINFHQRTQCLIDQYSKYSLREIDIPIDGVNTQGENIADNGGIRQAFRAYERWFTENDYLDELLPGVNATNFQLFFLNFAQIWCEGMRPEASRYKIKMAPHSPGRYRVIGTLSNSEEFARVFHCPLNTTMNPGNKCSLW